MDRPSFVRPTATPPTSKVPVWRSGLLPERVGQRVCVRSNRSLTGCVIDTYVDPDTLVPYCTVWWDESIAGERGGVVNVAPIVAALLEALPDR